MNSLEVLQTTTARHERGADPDSQAHGVRSGQNLGLVQGAALFPAVDSMRGQYVLVAENPEDGTSSATFVFDLAGVVWNGRTRDNSKWSEGATQTHGDHLASRLLPLLGENAEVRFIYQGGADTRFRWSIEGSVWGVSSREDAAARAEDMRRSMQMVLASEQCFSFLPRTAERITHAEPRPTTWKTEICPQVDGICVPHQSALGFTDRAAPLPSMPSGVRIALPIPGARSFRSLAEAVLLSPYPTMLAIGISRHVLDKTAREQLTAVLEWMRRRPAHVREQLSLGGSPHVLDEAIQRHFQEWIQNPCGARVRCTLWSDDQPAQSLAEVVGRDVFGTRVKPMTILCDADADTAETIESQYEVDLSGCLRSGDVWPALFPSIESISRARIRRLFNHEAPALDDEGILLGRLDEDPLHEVRLSEAGRQQHCYALGATGTGKSTLLFNMILQDIRAGRGVGVIDPHGDLYDQLLEAMPREREQDVVLFNPGDAEASPGINLLEYGKDNASFQINFAVNELLKTFERLYDMRICGGPMFESYFRNAMLLLLESDLDEVTLTELAMVFEDAEYRKFLKARCRNPLVVGFWTGQAERARGDASLESVGPYITSKINAFTCNAVLRAVIGQAKSTIDISSIINGRRILLVKLSKGMLGEMDAQLLGSVLLSKLFMAALARARMKSTERQPFYLYVDEFQNFVNDTVAGMMSEARKYGLYMTMANQTLSQLQANRGQQNVLDAVLGNVGNLIAFRVGPSDADKLRPYTEPEFGGLDVQSLPSYHAIGRMLSARGPTRPFVFRTDPAATTRDGERLTEDAWAKRERLFSTPIADVEAQIRRRRSVHKEIKKSEPVQPDETSVQLSKLFGEEKPSLVSASS